MGVVGPPPNLLKNDSNQRLGRSTATGKLVQFLGAISTSGTDSLAFVLPANMAPSKTVYVTVDLCNAANGRLVIEPNGAAFVKAENDFSDAQCFTSLENVSFLR